MSETGPQPYRVPPRIGVADAVRRCLQKFLIFSGRAPRAEFWKFALIVVVALTVCGMIERALGLPRLAVISVEIPRTTFFASIRGPLSAATLLLMGLPLLSAAVRRLHDTDRRGMWLALVLASPVLLLAAGVLGARTGVMPSLPLLLLLTLVPALVVMALLAAPTQPGPNRFGPNPLEVRA
ncbi:DUF805 domain-containing protein [Paracoccus sanguinis]|uniref:DUF805 domain-containing protein n=1 Tax=Paracoccus sanguinis TaxID=1545044 RepID=UPI001451F370|nr:DUF805 domain-containing protein [Paracoccus sanguinis]QJD16170.1 DUF805 domain-containing protein [Paracoccus sanguinis]